MDNSTFDLEALGGFIKRFQANEKLLIPDKTLFEIAGFPSRENVFSNVLKFYFDSRERHNLGTLVLKSFLRDVIGEVEDQALSTIQIKREVSTNTCKRIDLVIETQEYLIGIENKVYHTINNDLNEYAQHLASLSSSKKIILVILNLNKDDPKKDNSGFIFISYRKFINSIEDAIGEDNQNKYVVFLKEFIQNLKNHFPHIMTPEQIKFIAANEDNIEKIKELSSRTSNYLSTRLANIFKLVVYNKNHWYDYHEVTTTFELHAETAKYKLIKVACSIEISKIYFEAWCEKELFRDFQEWLNNKYNRQISIENDWLYFPDFNEIYNASDEQVSTAFNQLVSYIEEFMTINNLYINK